ncbi:actin-binding protein IPP-like [Stylophora pistillata]|uniref:actin-binding protein IPP-like n=1 Tax=Stylophora pistillata TaxID=50429 RepID=UPI000C053288|nr:actin-binding protein IPP-like [Stylophora pistillata]
MKDKIISPGIFKIVMDSIYTGDLYVNQKSVFEVLFTASQLQVASVVQLCCDFIKKEFIENGIDVKNYSVLCTVAERLGLRDLQEAAETKMAPLYKDVCESKEFLTHISAAQLLSLLGRDDLNSPSEAFVFKSAMKWIKCKGEERMEVAGKVIGAVRLGLVDVKIVIEELKTEEMQRVPEVNMIHLQESMMHHVMPSHEFAAEKVNLDQ